MLSSYALVPHAPQPIVASVNDADHINMKLPEKKEAKEPQDILNLRLRVAAQQAIVDKHHEMQKKENPGKYSQVNVERNKLDRLKQALEDKTKQRETDKEASKVQRLLNKKARDDKKVRLEAAHALGHKLLSDFHAKAGKMSADFAAQVAKYVETMKELDNHTDEPAKKKSKK